MSPDAKRELARTILATRRIREDSYAGEFVYRLSWYEAAQRACADVDPELTSLVWAACCAGFVEFELWAREILEKEKTP